MINNIAYSRESVSWLLLFLFVHAIFFPSFVSFLKDVHCSSQCCIEKNYQEKVICHSYIESELNDGLNLGKFSKDDDCQNGVCESLFCSHCQKIFLNDFWAVHPISNVYQIGLMLFIETSFYKHLFQSFIWHPPLIKSLT